MLTRSRVAVAVVALAAVLWVAWVTVSIATERPPGAPTLTALADDTARALNTRDADALAPLLQYPSSDGPAFAARYLDALGPDADAVTVVPDTAHDLLTVGLHRRGGGTATWQLAAVHDDDGRWLVSFLPPMPRSD